MNERIKELAEQAGMNTLHITTEELEKFTELIVKECCEVADLARKCFDVANDGNEDEYLGTTAGVEKFAELVILECARVVKASSPNGMIGVNAIRIHFGLEP